MRIPLLLVYLMLFATLYARSPRVFDCFPFFNELDLLELRLHELDPIVDYFVLVESVETHKNAKPKPLYFADNKARFAPFLPKIIHVVVESHPELSAWGRENYQRNAILRGLRKKAHPFDTVIISDADEILRPETILYIKEALAKNPSQFFSCAQRMFYFDYNRVYKGGVGWGGEPWFGSTASSYANVKRLSPQYLRDNREFFSNRLYNAGWHFSYLGGIEAIRLKSASMVEEGIIGSDEDIQAFIDQHETVPIDETFPSFLKRKL